MGCKVASILSHSMCFLGTMLLLRELQRRDNTAWISTEAEHVVLDLGFAFLRYSCQGSVGRAFPIALVSR